MINQYIVDNAEWKETRKVYESLAPDTGERSTSIDLFHKRQPLQLHMITKAPHHAILGTTGAGKTNTLVRILEQLDKCGQQFLAFDIEGDLEGMSDGRPGISVARGQLGSAMIKKIMLGLFTEKNSYVVSLQEHDEDRRDLFMHRLLETIWDFYNKNELQYRLFLIFDEAHEYIPQQQSSSDLQKQLRYLIIRIARRGRKRHINLFVVSQRPANVHKDVLSQCDAKLLHRVTSIRDKDQYKDMIVLHYNNGINAHLVERVFPNLQDGECYYTYVPSSNKRFSDPGFFRAMVKLRDSSERTQRSPRIGYELVVGFLDQKEVVVGKGKKKSARVSNNSVRGVV